MVVVRHTGFAQHRVDHCLLVPAEPQPTLALREVHDSQSGVELRPSEGELIVDRRLLEQPLGPQDQVGSSITGTPRAGWASSKPG